MIRHRTTARGILFLITALLAGLAAATASGHDEPLPGGAKPPPATKTTGGVPRLIFPVVGPATYVNDFGDARGRSSHQGNDIMAPKRALAVAAEAGKVKLHTTSSRAGCMLYLYGRSGTTYLYIHLNNDLTKGNDNRGRCVAGVAYAKGLKDGANVAAGEPVGYVGDSGDADGGGSHLHFEVKPKGRSAVSPFTHLRRARKLLFAAKPGTTVNLTLTGSLVDTTSGALKLKVSNLSAAPTGLRVPRVGRTVELTMPPTTVVFNPVGALIAVAKLQQAKPGQEAVVKTEPTRTTLRTQLGTPLSLSTGVVELAL